MSSFPYWVTNYQEKKLLEDDYNAKNKVSCKTYQSLLM